MKCPICSKRLKPYYNWYRKSEAHAQHTALEKYKAGNNLTNENL